ncbi:unnamed protein product [Adineta steineri]|uniref:Uncharacterized protein n=1 Tax=Adineta steineri TaxID=433720 RepID=A0A819F8H3_9BILA|nr:unnamed protein product [Adineta steineri]CAF0747872.1 unnamed protein product [Adineta steineri]CAF3862420.1 unnamed protein product [Adineta steineri]CAF3997940.1 unnamed protein product [Adineta steineri]
MFGVASSLSLQNLASTIGQDAGTMICNAYAQNKPAAVAFFVKLNGLFAAGVGSQKFPASVAYITTNEKALLAGTEPCPTFIVGLATAFQSDSQNNGVADAKATLTQFIQTNFPQLAALLG